MPFSHNVSITFSDSGAPGAASQIVATGDGQVNISVAYPDNASNFLATLQVKHQKIKNVVMWSTTDCTVTPRMGATPSDTIILAANQMIMSGETMPNGTELFIADCDQVAITALNGGTLHIHVLEDV